MPSAIEYDALEPFKIICVTCQAKLSVRNESLIGQIVACPRCDSMVEVTPPLVASIPATPSPVPTSEEAAADVGAADIGVADTGVAEEIGVAQDASLPATEAEMLLASAGVAKYKLIVWSLASFFVGAALVGTVLLTRNNPSNEATTLVPKNPALAPAPSSTSIAATLPTPNEPVQPSPPTVETPPTNVPKEAVPAPASDERITAQPTTEPVEQPTPITPTDELPEETPRIARRFDPLDFDPERLTLATIDQSPVPVEPSAPDSPDAVVEMPEEVPSTVPLVRRGPNGGEETRERDANKQLALLIPRMKIDKMSLVDSLRLFSHLSGVPMSVAPEQLLMAGITPQKRVSFAASEISLGEMLKQVLKPLRLEYTAHGAQIVVTRQEATKHREINYPIDDLVAANTSAEQLARWVEQLVLPQTWKSAGGEGTLEATTGSLRIGQTQQVHYQVLIFLERLRLARNLPPKSRYPVKRLAGTPANILLQEKLAKSATFTFSQFTAIDEIFVHWQTEFDAPLLIDWPALADTDIWPSTTIACAIIDKPWSDALGKVLEPLGLGWRATTGGAIEITSAEKVQNELQLELYPLRRNFEGDVAQLRALAKQQDAGVMLYDPVGKVLLALEPASTQRLIFRRISEQRLLRE
ncbi:MAG: hypothetical protein GXP24_05065 [Planctomycetes bacterium]|nr:hypothetical protein [Planctomycetota bacterium]